LPPVTSHWDVTATGSVVVSSELEQPQATLPADVKVLVRIPGVDGSSQSQGYVGWIEASSARIEARRRFDAPQSQPILTSFRFAGENGWINPQLVRALADGRTFTGKDAIQVVTLQQTPNGSVREIARWDLNDATVASYVIASAWQEAFSLNYGQMELAYTPYSASGTPEPVIRVPWDLAMTGSALLHRDAEFVYPTVPANVELLMRIPGIDGASKRQGYAGWIEVDSWSKTISSPDTGAGAGFATPLVLDLCAGPASPLLLEGVAESLSIPQIELVALFESEGVEFAHLIFEDVTLRAFQTRDSSSDRLAVDFDRLQLTFRGDQSADRRSKRHHHRLLARRGQWRGAPRESPAGDPG
jgi:type VI protein secretion system component Hcp